MKKMFSIFVIVGLILGIIFGCFLPNFAGNFSFLGTIYINLLKFMIIPVIFTSITVTTFNSTKQKNKILLKTVATFVIMFVVSFLITSILVVLLKPTNGFIFSETNWDGQVTNFSISEILINLFPTNFISMFENNNIFSTILFAAILGVCASKVKNGNKVIDFLSIIKDMFFKLLEIIMYFTPIGVFALVYNTVATYGTSVFSIGAKYIGFAYLASIVVLFLVMILPVWIIAKINPIKYIKKVCKVWLITLTTCSSAATLPYTIKTCNEDFNVPEEITNVVVPLGCTIHMCGGAVSFALLGLFCAGLFGVNINIATYVIMLISATLINMAAPGIPNGGIVIGATYLSILGIPLSFIGFYSGIYKLLDMAYTTLNVTGDISANILINSNNINNKV